MQEWEPKKHKKETRSQRKKDVQPWWRPSNKHIPKFTSLVLLARSHPSCDPQQHAQGDLSPMPPNAEQMAAMDQQGRGVAIVARSPMGQSAEGVTPWSAAPSQKHIPAESAALPEAQRRGRDLK